MMIAVHQNVPTTLVVVYDFAGKYIKIMEDKALISVMTFSGTRDL